MPGKRDKPTFKSREKAEQHGFIQYGKTKSGARKFRVYAVRGGYNVSKRK